VTPRQAPATARRGSTEPVAATARFLAWRRERRRRRYLRPLLVLLAVGCVAGTAAWVALGSSMFALRSVTVEGVARLTAGQVLDRAALPQGRSLLLIDPAAVAKRVEKLPPVESVDVTRRWPHAIVISVTERRPVAVVAGTSGWQLIDINGVAFATVGSPPTGLIPVRVGEPMSAGGADDARSALRVYRALPKSLRSQVVQLQADSPRSVTFALRNGREVVWGSPTDNVRKLAVLRALLPRHAVRYDVSSPDVAVTS
jgi:cell division protein FtsQ